MRVKNPSREHRAMGPEMLAWLEANRACMVAMREAGSEQAVMAEKLGVSKMTISRCLRRLGFYGDNYNFLKKLTARQESILRGTLFGDAGLEKSGRAVHALVAITHGDSQKAYLAWIVAELAPAYLSQRLAMQYREASRGKTVKHWRARTRSHPIFSALYDEYCTRPDDECASGIYKKRVTTALLAKISGDHLAMAVWFADDGCGSAGALRLVLGGMTDREYDLIGAWWGEQGFPAKVKRVSVANAALVVWSAEVSRRLIAALRPHTPDCMQYKFENASADAVAERRSRPQPYDTLVSMLYCRGLTHAQIREELDLNASQVALAVWRGGLAWTQPKEHPMRGKQPFRHRKKRSTARLDEALLVAGPAIGDGDR